MHTTKFNYYNLKLLTPQLFFFATSLKYYIILGVSQLLTLLIFTLKQTIERGSFRECAVSL